MDQSAFYPLRVAAMLFASAALLVCDAGRTNGAE
jgi:hypothetical protein